jgi:hypothetical protein
MFRGVIACLKPTKLKDTQAWSRFCGEEMAEQEWLGPAYFAGS